MQVARQLVFLAVLVSTACLPDPAAAQPRCASPEGALPAGVYWATIGWYEEPRLCPAPSVALVEGVYPSERAARRAVRGLPEVQFEPGFPWVVEARYAGLDADGVAVVLGWFEPFRWMPVRCGRALAWIERTSTSEQAVTWVNDEGRAQVTQVTLVECDSPTHTTWEIDETGRRVHPVVSAGGCGGEP